MEPTQVTETSEFKNSDAGEIPRRIHIRFSGIFISEAHKSVQYDFIFLFYEDLSQCRSVMSVIYSVITD
jgi:hypothetical protein